MGCKECTIKGVRVPSENNGSKVTILVEAPGEEETNQLKPLVGKTGRILWDLLKTINKQREDFNLVNSVSCRTMVGNANRKPSTAEIRYCSDNLKQDIKIQSPNIIVVMGHSAYVSLGGNPNTQMGSIVGSLFTWNEYDCIVTYHPSSIIYAMARGIEMKKKTELEITTAILKACNFTPSDKQLRLL
jgi:DNA polymerase